MLVCKPFLALQLLAVMALLGTGAAHAHAQQSTGTVRGTVRHVGSGAPLGSVQIIVAGTRIGAATKDDGSYIILNVPAGTQRLQARVIGFAPTQKAVTVTTDASAIVDFDLSPAAAALEEVVITGTAGSARRRE